MSDLIASVLTLAGSSTPALTVFLIAVGLASYAIPTVVFAVACRLVGWIIAQGE